MMERFIEWVRELEEDVIQGEFGFEPGEFSVSPSHWRPLFRQGLTPHQAFRHALDECAAALDEDDRRKLENWERIKVEDAAAIAAYRLQATAAPEPTE
jgi:hypothetical protein